MNITHKLYICAVLLLAISDNISAQTQPAKSVPHPRMQNRGRSVAPAVPAGKKEQKPAPAATPDAAEAKKQAQASPALRKKSIYDPDCPLMDKTSAVQDLIAVGDQAFRKALPGLWAEALEYTRTHSGKNLDKLYWRGAFRTAHVWMLHFGCNGYEHALAITREGLDVLRKSQPEDPGAVAGAALDHPNDTGWQACEHCQWNCGRAVIVMLGMADTQDEVFTEGTSTLSENHGEGLIANDYTRFGMNPADSFVSRYDGIRTANAAGIIGQHSCLIDGARKNIDGDIDDEYNIAISDGDFHSFNPGADNLNNQYAWQSFDFIYVGGGKNE